MHSKTVHVAAVAVTTFIPWLIMLAALNAASSFARPAFLIIHYFLAIFLFGVAFAIYYKDRQGTDPFTVTAIAMLSLFVYEFIYLAFVSEVPRWFLTYSDWLVPIFLTASTIYWIGVYVHQES